MSVVAMPSQTTHHMTHLDNWYNDMMKHLKVELKNVAIWISLDETMDSVDTYIVNIIGKLEREKYNAHFLVNCVFLEKTDSSAIAKLVNDTLSPAARI